MSTSNIDLHHDHANSTVNPPVKTTPYDNGSAESTNTVKKSSHLLSPTVKGALIGAVAGHFLPVFNTLTGAIVGGITAKVLNRQCKKTA